MNKILYAADLSLAVYSNRPPLDHDGISGVVEIRNVKTGVDGFCFVSVRDKTLHIVFRGSESPVTKEGRIDWRHNLMVKKSEWSGIQAHGGVVRCADSVYQRVQSIIDAFPGWAVTLQGHSAGGNVATLIAVALCRKYRHEPDQQLCLITFGQSRVASSADLHRTIWCRYIRVQNGSDAVCRWPKGGYGDYGTNLYFPRRDRMGEWVIDPSASAQTRDILLSTVGRVLDHRMSEYRARVAAAAESGAVVDV